MEPRHLGGARAVAKDHDGWANVYSLDDDGLNVLNLNADHRLYRLRFPERNLKRIRRNAGMSQGELAARSGVSVRTIQELEQGRKDVNRAGIDTLMPLAAALSVDVEALVERVV